MNDYLRYIKIIFIAAFILLCTMAFIYNQFWVGPGRACEADHNWWDPKTRSCGHAIWLQPKRANPLADRQKPWEQPIQKVR